MAKDPAFLFYPNDYIGGTMGMTFEEKGAYIELLMVQFNRGHMTTHMIAQTVGKLWESIKCKFIQDESGLWYNERLEREKLLRKQYTESRRNNKEGKNQHKKGHKVGHMTSHMENEDINENKDSNIVNLPFKNFEFESAWNDWKEYKQSQHKFKFKSQKSEQTALNQLSELSKNSSDIAIKIINQSIANGWKGFFELKNLNNGNNKKQTGVEQLLAKAKLDFQTYSG